MVWQIGPEGPDPTPLSERPLDVLPFSKPPFRIVRAPVTGWARLPETFRQMAPGQILLVKSRHGKPQPRVNDAAKKANVEIEIQSRPFQDDILVTVLGPRAKEKTSKPKSNPAVVAPKQPSTPTEPRTRCFGRMYPKAPPPSQPSSPSIDIFS